MGIEMVSRVFLPCLFKLKSKHGKYLDSEFNWLKELYTGKYFII